MRVNAARWMLMPVSTCEQMTSGRWLPSARRGFAMLIGIGWPVWKVNVASSPASRRRPVVQRAAHIAADRSVRDRMGDCATTAVTKRFVASFALIDHSSLRLSSSCGLPLFRISDKCVEAHRGVIFSLRPGVVALEGKILVLALLEANLQRVIPGGWRPAAASPEKAPSNWG